MVIFIFRLFKKITICILATYFINTQSDFLQVDLPHEYEHN